MVSPLIVRQLSPNVVLDSVVSSDKTSPAKELAHRLPDPEHLRAVWSQVSNSSDVPTANSLKGIADDLTAIPFTLHEVKSEDGGTPPPGTLPSRMSIHDVTRAFQKVPAGSSGSPSHAPISPPSNAQSLRRPSYGFPSPSTGSGSRPLYPAYHPQPMGSPAPAMVYPAHVAPGMTRPMVPGTHSSQPQPGMWVQVPHPPGPTTPIGAMQYMPTPYSPQVVGYGNMNMHPGMYMQQMPNGAGTPAATPQHHHGHAMPPPLTPVITQPVPGYPTNPYQPYPSPVTPGGRGMLPSNSHSSMSPRQTPHTHSAPYNPVPASYGRPTW
jgi:serine/arginine repetitive matrix protein 2